MWGSFTGVMQPYIASFQDCYRTCYLVRTDADIPRCLVGWSPEIGHLLGGIGAAKGLLIHFHFRVSTPDVMVGG